MRVQQGRNLTYGLVESLGQSIVTGEYGADRPFPNEAELATMFGASRSVTREAVKMLTAKGLLSARPRQGTSVEPESQWNLFDPDVLRWHLDRKFSLKLLLDFTEIRIAIEPQAAHLAALKADDTAIAEIRRGVERMYAAEKGHDDGLSADIAFHVAVMKATNNPFYAQLSDIVTVALKISIRFTNSLAGRHANVGAHEAVLDAIAARDPATAQARMNAIIVDVMGLIHKAMADADKARKAGVNATA
jgi:DNA-binding FadR family transcriptional regulator